MFTWWQKRKKEQEKEEKEREAKRALEEFDELLGSFGAVQAVESATGVPRLWAACGVVLVSCVLFVRIAGLSLFANVVGLAYPAWASLETLESQEKPIEDFIQWLMYWTVFGLLHLFELATEPLFEWGVYFYSLKIVFLLWCFVPVTMGATTVYEAVIQPLLKRHEDHIDEKIAAAGEVGFQATGEIGRVGSRFLGTAASTMAKSVLNVLAEDEQDAIEDGDDDDMADDEPGVRRRRRRRRRQDAPH